MQENRVKYSKWKAFKKYMGDHGILFHLCATILWIWAISLVVVIFMGILISLTKGRQYELYPNRIFPDKLYFANYANAFKEIKYGDTTYFGMFWNAIWYSVGCTVCRLSATALCAYVLAKYEFKGKKPLYAFLIFQLMLPTYSGGVSNFVFMYEMGLVDTPLFLISQFAGHGGNFLIMHSYFLGIAPEYKEAASLDGANDFQFFFKIIVPIARAPIMAIGIMQFVGLWNDYMTPMIYLPSFPTLMTGLFRYKIISIYTLDIPTFFAGVLISALPTATIFTLFSGELMKNLTIGGIKG